MTNKIPKKKRSFNISPEVFIRLKVYSSKHNVPYGVILEALADAYTNDPASFPPLDFEKYR